MLSSSPNNNHKPAAIAVVTSTSGENYLQRVLWYVFEVVFYSAWFYTWYCAWRDDWLNEWSRFLSDGAQIYNPFSWSSLMVPMELEDEDDASEYFSGAVRTLDAATGWMHSTLATPALVGLWTLASSLMR